MTIRDKVAEAIAEHHSGTAEEGKIITDAALLVVAEWIESDEAIAVFLSASKPIIGQQSVQIQTRRHLQAIANKLKGERP
jgi:hypothetical protein